MDSRTTTDLLNTDDFSFSLDSNEEESLAIIDHLKVSEDLRGNGYGSIILETIKRIVFKNEEIDVLKVSIGGGENTEDFLKSNGFKIVNKRNYPDKAQEYTEGEYGVDAEYHRKWISEDY